MFSQIHGALQADNEESSAILKGKEISETEGDRVCRKLILRIILEEKNNLRQRLPSLSLDQNNPFID
ncbi:hypothetical protein, partial [Klebsiella pneumoniae]|uniref:hypothetical protein n=1 Tax=Klebsiella pneumoniae TaxID=573 RepID=UPI003D0527B3